LSLVSEEYELHLADLEPEMFDMRIQTTNPTPAVSLNTEEGNKAMPLKPTDASCYTRIFFK
jgi:hypothetical protein